ncbi:MAG TPA: hypothetical protein VE843_06380 [Ktedonobacteraceae bacterium]|nr:hypothetical protein [Ktedonobacteraceae bacterium]
MIATYLLIDAIDVSQVVSSAARLKCGAALPSATQDLILNRWTYAFILTRYETNGFLEGAAKRCTFSENTIYAARNARIFQLISFT